jgi:hypothetical protein
MTNLQKLSSNTGCFVNYDIGTGLWGVTINRDISPSLAFDDSNIISGVDLTGTNLDNMYNAVEVEFPHRQLRDQIDSIRIDLPSEFRNANEPDNILKIRLDLLNEPLQARELGYLELYQNRMDQVITFTSDYSKINTEAGDVITITNTVYGWTAQPFRVVRVREVEAEDGGLAVEITAQEYDATMYTAGGQPRRPRMPSQGIGIPGIAVIGTPAAPTITLFNSVAVPAINITGLTPSGIVDQFEYWYSADAGTTYNLIGISRNANGSPYNQNTSLSFRADKLIAGTYLFKVRGGNATAFGPYSDASASTVWLPVQVTDAVTADTQVSVPGLGDLLGPLAMGAVAYFAYQALYPEAMKLLGDTAIGEALGIPSSAIQNMKDAAGNFKLINAGGAILSPYQNDTITFEAGAGITIEAEATTSTITITSVVTNAFKTVTVGTDVIEANAENTNITFLHGAGIVIEAFPGTNTIKITADATVQEDGDDFNAEKDVDFGAISSTNTYTMDACRVSISMPPKLKRRTGVYENPRAGITGGASWASDCYGTSMPTLIIPGHGTTVNPTVHPLTQGSFTINSTNTALNGKRVYYRALSLAQVIAYCNFDDAGNTLTVPGSSCSLTPPSSRPVFSTYEFPAGNRFVTFDMIREWCISSAGVYPINTLTYTTVASNEYYATNSEITQQARICQNADKSEPSYAF